MPAPVAHPNIAHTVQHPTYIYHVEQDYTKPNGASEYETNTNKKWYGLPGGKKYIFENRLQNLNFVEVPQASIINLVTLPPPKSPPHPVHDYGTIHGVQQAYEKPDGSLEYEKDGKWYKLPPNSKYTLSENLMNL